MAVDQSLLERIAASLRVARASLPPETSARSGSAPREKDSILARAAELYGVRPSEESTPPTGFDPAAAALFEALVEGAFLVAHADGEFDDEERAAFEQVVLAATNKQVAVSQLHALLADLGELYEEDGAERRIQVVTKTVSRTEQQHEVLRVAALIAQISGGVSAVERATMEKLATGFGLDPQAVDASIRDAEGVLAASSS